MLRSVTLCSELVQERFRRVLTNITVLMEENKIKERTCRWKYYIPELGVSAAEKALQEAPNPGEEATSKSDKRNGSKIMKEGFTIKEKLHACDIIM